MYQCARFLFHSVWTSLGAVLAFAAIVIAVLVTAIAAGIAVITYQTRKKQKEDG